MRRRALAAAAWVWVPPEATDFETEEYRLLVHPDQGSVAWSRTARPLAAVVEEVMARVRAAGRDKLRWWVTPRTEPADTGEQLEALGFVAAERLDILACELGEAIVERLSVPGDVEVRAADDPEALEAGGRLGASVFGDPMPSPALLADSARLADEGRRTGRWSARQYVAYVDGRLAGHGGCTFAGESVRLWGGAVAPWARRRGVYRALVAARCRFALEQDASLAVVKARADTSAPILLRAGFAAFGTEQAYDLRAP